MVFPTQQQSAPRPAPPPQLPFWGQTQPPPPQIGPNTPTPFMFLKPPGITSGQSQIGANGLQSQPIQPLTPNQIRPFWS